VLLGVAVVSEVAATLSLRASEGLRRRRWIVPVVVLYGIAFSLLTLTLSKGMPVGIAYGVWAASGVALTAVGARVLFKEPLTWRMAAGIGLIAAGVFIVELGATH
jgi:small multidrug resistance pump